MSNTLIDQRFQANACRAEVIANKVAIWTIFFVTILFTAQLTSPKAMLSLLISTIGSSFGLSAFWGNICFIALKVQTPMELLFIFDEDEPLV